MDRGGPARWPGNFAIGSSGCGGAAVVTCWLELKLKFDCIKMLQAGVCLMQQGCGGQSFDAGYEKSRFFLPACLPREVQGP